ncbi:MAG: flagellar biosynthesis anti-sigma factor FlgM [Sedimentisphaerales bacterium]|nr:flagellar biosynthesis anti-sigma factor FlgM [Sedimentisphaerales bacterium]
MHTPDHEVQEPMDMTSEQSERFAEFLDIETDYVAEGLLENISASPLGKLLKIIGNLPEIRQEKVGEIRRQLDHDEYEISEHLDVALDRVLEEFIAEGN